MGLWHAYFSRTSLPWHPAALVSSADWSFFGSYSSRLRFFPAITVSWSVALFLSVLPTPPSLRFRLLFCPRGCKKLETRKCALVVFLCPFPTAFSLPWVKLLFSPALQRCQLHLCSPLLSESSRGVGAGVGGGLAGGHSPFLRGSRSASFVRTQDQAMGNRPPDSHHGLYKYYFHLAWPFIVL